MHNLIIRHKIEIPLHHIIGASALTFSKWFPLDDNDRIVINEDDKKVEIWFDKSCLHFSQINEDLENHVNVMCLEAYVDVTIFKVSKKLVEFLKKNIQKIVQNDDELINQAKNLGETVYIACISGLNNLINYCRYVKNQYWLDEIHVDIRRIQSFNVEVNAKAITDEINTNHWFRWRPIHSDLINILIPDEKVYITKDDWGELKKFIGSGKRINFSLELISKAKVLKSYGYANNAIVDSVIALEIALYEFGKQPNREKLIVLGTDLEIDSSLEKTFAKLGFSTSVKYLLPLILPKSIVDKITFENVNELITIRQNIIHNGQKRVEKNKLKLIYSAEKLTRQLIDLTLKR
jgi:hypothetical protein